MRRTEMSHGSMPSMVSQLTGTETLTAGGAEIPDEALLERFVKYSDRRSFEILMRRYQFEVYNYLRRYLADDHLAEDAFQLTFISVFQKGQQFDCSRRFRPWLYGIATNQAIDLKRSISRKPHFSLDAPLSRSPGKEISNSDQLPDHRQIEGDLLEKTEMCDQLRSALEQVGEPGKSALDLIYLQGMAYKDAAKALNVPVGTVKSRVHSAVRKLSEVWQRTIGKKLEPDR
jgi:RNA polymerase sigma-70 factor (ECF subfamily)